jgi:predicted kinase
MGRLRRSNACAAEGRPFIGHFTGVALGSAFRPDATTSHVKVSFPIGTGCRTSLDRAASRCHAEWMLIVMAGLPGSGQSTVAVGVARQLQCAMVSVDPIEAAMWRSGISRAQPTGLAAYVVAEAIAEQQLRFGHDVIVDAVNDVQPARQQWRDLAGRFGEAPIFVEVFCSDPVEHRRRLETRQRDLPGLLEPHWDSLAERKTHFDEWTGARLKVDSMCGLESSIERVIAEVARRQESR